MSLTELAVLGIVSIPAGVLAGSGLAMVIVRVGTPKRRPAPRARHRASTRGRRSRVVDDHFDELVAAIKAELKKEWSCAIPVQRADTDLIAYIRKAGRRAVREMGYTVETFVSTHERSDGTVLVYTVINEPLPPDVEGRNRETLLAALAGIRAARSSEQATS
ncbi:MAG TPA: hypothetical protein VE326_11255 [Candidatus Binatia bacterium]|nr:hypothetical protein [Candidatus Binatia bacterium]